ncbi:hypothetical protein K4L44_08465 [Halosquirtibacter laminarini]|uniref:Uncharacterized protein n=1 Tax=Halosquirtibacter laminarini TaxID=3374600 RepID=A0AC61NRD0_9BACT|nr:hypothetical protein K4L44_08465 [Prolixibacteraceae bacterium]
MNLGKVITLLSIVFGTLIVVSPKVVAQRQDTILIGAVYEHPIAKPQHPLRNRGVVKMDYVQQDIPTSLSFQNGEQLNHFRFNTSQIISNEDWSYWGEAQYLYETRKDKKGSLCTTPSRLGPYQVTDTIGGDQFLEQYNLKGGISLQHNSLIWGVESSYMLSEAYTKNDPRTLNKNSELSGSASLGWKNKYFNIGVAAKYNSYKQKISIKNFTPSRRDKIYVVQGLGTFSNNYTVYDRNFSTLYRGNRMEGSIFIYSNHNKSWSIDLKVIRETITQEDGSTSREPFTFQPTTYQLNIQDNFRIGAIQWQSMVNLIWNSATGKERIYKKEVIDPQNYIYDYQLITTLNKYSSQHAAITWNNILSLDRGKSSYWLNLNANLQQNEMHYTMPEDKLKQTFIDPSISFRHRINISNKISWEYGFGAMAHILLNKESIISSTPQRVKGYIEGLQKSLETPYQRYNLFTELGYKLKNKQELFVRLNGDQWQANEKTYSTQITLGYKL